MREEPWAWRAEITNPALYLLTGREEGARWNEVGRGDGKMKKMVRSGAADTRFPDLHAAVELQR